MSWFTDLWQVGATRNAVIEIALISVLSATVGVYLVLRNGQFLAAGLTHATFPGVVIAATFGGAPLVGSLVFAVILASFLSRAQVVSRAVSESDVVGVLLAGTIGIGVVFGSLRPGASKRLASTLVGSILTIDRMDLVITGSVVVLVVAMFASHYAVLRYASFDSAGAQAAGIFARAETIGVILIAISVVSLVPAVGAVQAASLLSIPPLGARFLAERPRQIMVLTGLITFMGGCLGLVIANATRIAPSSGVVLTIVGVVGLCWVMQAARSRWILRGVVLVTREPTFPN